MKSLPKLAGTTVLLLFAALASGSAFADHYGHAYGGNVRFGISFGFPLYSPGYYPAHYYPYPAYAYPAPVYAYPPMVIQAAPPVYVEQSAAQAQADWYYCASANAYYPYVAQCPSGWQRVPPQAAPR